MTDTEKEIAGLRTQIAEAEARIAKLEVKQRRVFQSPPPPPDDEGVRITEIQPEVACALPDAEQMQQLMDIVLERFPELGPQPRFNAPHWEIEDCQRRWRVAFRWSFVALAAMRRMDRPDSRRYASDFRDHCESWLRSHGICVDIGAAFTAAALAFGDIPWADFREDGIVLELGLNAYVGTPASADAWRRVLETGQILLPTPKALRQAARGPSRVFYG